METERVIHLLELEKEYALKQRGFQQQPINKEVAEALDIAIEAVKFHGAGEACFKALQAMAETDVVQVVKCKDCKYSKYKPIIGNLEEGDQTALLYCTMFVNGQHIYEDDYCSYGGRKAEE